MATGNGEIHNDQEMTDEVKKEDIEPMDQTEVPHSEDYKKLIEYGLNDKVASQLDEIFQTGITCLVLIV